MRSQPPSVCGRMNMYQHNINTHTHAHTHVSTPTPFMSRVMCLVLSVSECVCSYSLHLNRSAVQPLADAHSTILRRPPQHYAHDDADVCVCTVLDIHMLMVDLMCYTIANTNTRTHTHNQSQSEIASHPWAKGPTIRRGGSYATQRGKAVVYASHCHGHTQMCMNTRVPCY